MQRSAGREEKLCRDMQVEKSSCAMICRLRRTAVERDAGRKSILFQICSLGGAMQKPVLRTFIP